MTIYCFAAAVYGGIGAFVMTVGFMVGADLQTKALSLATGNIGRLTATQRAAIFVEAGFIGLVWPLAIFWIAACFVRGYLGAFLGIRR